MPFEDVTIDSDVTPTVYTLYVSGAVERDGFYQAEAGVSYDEIFQKAGLLPQSVLPVYSAAVDGSISAIVIDYYDEGKVCSCINANSEIVALRFPVDGVSQQAVERIADYLEQHGKIHNKFQLKIALGDLYDECGYKFFVAMEDYEAAD